MGEYDGALSAVFLVLALIVIVVALWASLVMTLAIITVFGLPATWEIVAVIFIIIIKLVLG